MGLPAPRLRDPDLRPLGPEDAEACRRLSALVGWAHEPADWRVRLAVGRGLGVRDADGGLVAVGVRLAGAPGIGFIGLVLTDPERRGEGLGGAVTAALAAELRAEGRTPCLFAVPQAVGLYARLGFADRGALETHRGTLAPPVAPAAGGVRVRPLAAADFGACLALDREAYGGDRAALIADQLGRFPHLAFVAGAPGEPLGFALGAARAGLTTIGPVVARTDEAALALLAALAGAAGPGRIRCDRLGREAPDAFDDWLARFAPGERMACRLMMLGASSGPIYPSPAMLFAAQSALAG